MSLITNFRQRTYLGYLAILRIAVGYHFLTAALPKITGKFLEGRILAEELTKTAVNDPLAWHRSFILGFVVPHAHSFSHLVAFGELAIGISLLLGCLSIVRGISQSKYSSFNRHSEWRSTTRHQSNLYLPSIGIRILFCGSIAGSGWASKKAVSQQ
jgi:thiosulfate dehydrogenase (quinone) large subunit